MEFPPARQRRQNLLRNMLEILLMCVASGGETDSHSSLPIPHIRNISILELEFLIPRTLKIVSEFKSMNVKGLNTELKAICYNNANISHDDGQILTKIQFKMNLLTRVGFVLFCIVFQLHWIYYSAVAQYSCQRSRERERDCLLEREDSKWIITSGGHFCFGCCPAPCPGVPRARD